MSESLRSSVHVRELFPARGRDRRAFAALPFALARTVAAWQPGLRKYHHDLIHPKRNPFWKDRDASFFVAERQRRIVGRIAVVTGCIKDRPEAALLAFPDFTDDPDVTDPLFEVAEARARERGARALVGPMNPDIHHDVGIQISGHERRNAIFMGYQPPYYARHFERRGYQRLQDFAAWRLDRDTFIAGGRLERLVRRVEQQQALRIREINLRQFPRELEIFHRLYSGAFADHWGFAAPSWEEFRFIAGDLRYVLRGRMALIAEWNGVPVGFVLGVPDLYAILPKRTSGRLTPTLAIELLARWHTVDEARVMIAGVLPAYRKFGVHLSLFHRVAREIFDLGFRGGEISWVLAENRPMAKVLPLLGAHCTKVYRLFEKRLHQ